MGRGRVHVGLSIAALTLVLGATALSNSDGVRGTFDFAQYPGSGRETWKEEFRFVIVGDRTHSPQWGLMPQAFREINHLCPDFVISVGDLIDGYGEDPREIHDLWKEFDNEVATLQSPFVYVPGNHDIWNRTSRGIYEVRYGLTYRSFNYCGLHFVTLDTEEQDEQQRPVERIRGNQLEWLKADIEQNRGARRILLFMHRPIWQAGGLDQVYPLLDGLPVHVFAGPALSWAVWFSFRLTHCHATALGQMTGWVCVRSALRRSVRECSLRS